VDHVRDEIGKLKFEFRNGFLVGGDHLL
jgi:hypothetical protein